MSAVGRREGEREDLSVADILRSSEKGFSRCAHLKFFIADDVKIVMVYPHGQGEMGVEAVWTFCVKVILCRCLLCMAPVSSIF